MCRTKRAHSAAGRPINGLFAQIPNVERWPAHLDAVACDFPDLKLIGIHIGIPWQDEMIAMAWKHPNVFIGCDAHAPKYLPESFVRYLNSYGQDKVLFGTTFRLSISVVLYRK